MPSDLVKEDHTLPNRSTPTRFAGLLATPESNLRFAGVSGKCPTLFRNMCLTCPAALGKVTATLAPNVLPSHPAAAASSDTGHAVMAAYD